MKKQTFLQAFMQPLTGEIAHNKIFTFAKKPAAVLICIYAERGQLQVLFTERASHLKHHAGEVSFPGGKAEQCDNSLIDTAYREANEEIGLDCKHLSLVGRLGQYNTISGFIVSPIIAFYEHPLDIASDLTIDSNEVASAFSVPLDFLLNDQHYFSQTVTRRGLTFPIYFIHYQNKLIWGATAGMMYQLKCHLKRQVM